MKLCECGCGDPAPIAARSDPSRGYVKGKPCRFLPGHNHRQPGRPDYVAVQRDFESPCWEWLGAKSPAGYGQRRWAGRTQNAHRVAYLLHHSIDDLPGEIHIDHLCRNRLCVNPGHLEAVPHAENTRRGRTAKLTPEIVRRIRETDGEIGCREWGRRLGISHTVASQIRTGKVWVGV